MVIKDKVPAKIFHVETERDAQIVSGVILGLQFNQKWVVTIGQDDESRSLKQNRLSHLWYAHLGRKTGNGRDHERAMAKLLIGVPILCVGKDFNEFYAKALAPLEFSDRLAAMDFVPVTSLMTMGQFAEYLDTLDKKSVQRGIVLPQPEDLYFDALMKEVGRERI